MTSRTLPALLIAIEFAVGLALAVMPSAAAAQPTAAAGHHKAAVKVGNYDPLVADERKGKTADVGLVVKAKGRKLVFPTGASCTPGAKAISAGFDPNGVVSVHIQHPIAVSKKGSFNYSGTVTMPPEDTGTGMTYKTRLDLSGSFVLNKKIKTGKTIAVKGKFSAPDLCATTTLKKFADVYEPPGT